MAAAFTDPALCRWLIDQGLDGTVCGKLEVSLTSGIHVSSGSGTYVNAFSIPCHIPGYGEIINLYNLCRTPLAVAAHCSGRKDGTYEHQDFYIKAIAAGHPRPRNIWNRAADTLETLRVLVEHGQSDPTMIDSNGDSAFDKFTGRAEHFNYLFRQEHFQVDLFQNKNEDFALTQSYARLDWDHSLTIALICLEQEKLIWEKNFHSSKPPKLALAKTWATLLHGAARHMTSSPVSVFLEYGEGHFAEVRDLIKQVVASGADIHATIDDLYANIDDLYIDETKHLTPLDRLLVLYCIPETLQEGKDIIGRIIVSLKRWLRALKVAGVDLKEYIREEKRLVTLNKKEVWRPPRFLHYRVNWRIEVSENQEDYSIFIEYEFRERIERKEEYRIPGEWIEDDRMRPRRRPSAKDLALVDYEATFWLDIVEEDDFQGGWIEEDWLHHVFGIDSSVVPPVYI